MENRKPGHSRAYTSEKPGKASQAYAEVLKRVSSGVIREESLLNNVEDIEMN